MRSERYSDYTLWGHAILQQKDAAHAEHAGHSERYGASGTITRDSKVIEASGVLGLFDSEEEAEDAGLSWARAWIDSHG
jgi:hypothetical protein